MRFPRMTTRRWLVVVAMIAIPLGLCEERRSRFLATAAWHDRQAAEFQIDVYWVDHSKRDGWFMCCREQREFGYDEGLRRIALHEWHQNGAEKYRAAALHPWLPIAPDPPEPE